MKILKFSDPDIFQSVVKQHLLKHEAENNLPLGILSSLIAGEYRDQPPYLAQVEDQGETELVVMCTPPYPVLISFEEKPLNEEVVSLVIDDLVKELGDNLTGMTGSNNMVSQFADTWQVAAGGKAILKMAMRTYKLVQVSPVSGIPGSMRPANEADTSLLLDWYGNFHRESLVEKPDPERIKVQVERYLKADPHLRGMMIWEDGGNPVSMAGYSGPTTNGIRIGAVYTPPALRRKGYASACVAGLSQYLLDIGFKFCFLFTDLVNPISNHIYQQIGYQAENDVDTFEFKRL
jgi:hypothetical protein